MKPRRAAARARSPSRRTHGAGAALFDFWAARLSRTWAWQRTLARVVDVRIAAAGAVTLVLRPNRHWRGVVAGQHVNVTVEIDGRRMTRSYSPAAAAGTTRNIELTIKHVHGGRVSTHLCTQVRAGDVLELGAAFGAMRLPEPAAPLLLLAAGSGITPIHAMLRASVAQGRGAPLTLLYWARTREEFCFAQELRALAAQHAHIDVRFVLTSTLAALPDEAEGRLDAAHLATHIDATTHVFACGPDGFVEHARSLATARGATFTGEAFTPPVASVEQGGSVDVTLARSGITLQLPRGVSLLDALEAHGVRPPSGCRMGICNTCACAKASGTTRLLRTGEHDSEPASALRLCVNAASSNLVLDL